MGVGGKEMDSSTHENCTLGRAASQRALHMGSSFPCQVCVVGFLYGICLTTFFVAVIASFGSFEFGGIPLITRFSTAITPSNSTPDMIHMFTTDERVSLLYSAWSAELNKQKRDEGKLLPKAPHLENCQLNAQLNKRLDNRVGSERFPPWTIWKGSLGTYQLTTSDKQLKHYRQEAVSEGGYPPWIEGSDEENYPLTRKVQRDIWLHQHPMNCSDPNVRFLVADWETLPRLGFGALIVGMSGLFAIAIEEKRVLVTDYYNRADHDGCRGPSRSSWSCYFFPETSQECRERAFQLKGEKEAWEKGIITGKGNYTGIWSVHPPRGWGVPWRYLQPTTDINGTLMTYHHRMDTRWWRAQAVRYLMRFQTEYTCNLLNAARHAAFGWEAVEMVLATLNHEWSKDITDDSQSDLEQFVWSNHKPWMPRPLLSMHVRMGDKASEMKLAEFGDYMRLADRIRKRFPHLNTIWLSTEMQEVIDKSTSDSYFHWKFYYTNVTRQVGNTPMASYESSLGRESSTTNSLVNFLMAVESDFFIGALGSTWCFLIDGMRNTGGKVMAGYLSVNKDRYW